MPFQPYLVKFNRQHSRKPKMMTVGVNIFKTFCSSDLTKNKGKWKSLTVLIFQKFSKSHHKQIFSFKDIGESYQFVSEHRNKMFLHDHLRDTAKGYIQYQIFCTLKTRVPIYNKFIAIFISLQIGHQRQSGLSNESSRRNKSTSD
jgi:hypothetical protein